ncbi:hypothetical protein C7999DRAFT_39190 [Corynascus novoguineensis]|uniref:DUF2461 domain-containing protein n=1 Tax=Corynascus novoguineensis TaxID=1126955 RepID=A0AAN7CWI5_9PEZI|nr:hypothetical protein C7999DRAFT_39190 [Corynascus novoguineensis]
MPARKRKSTATIAETGAATPQESSTRRRSLRVLSTGEKSKYFEADSDSDTKNESTPKKGRARGRPAKKAKVEGESDDNADEYKGKEADDAEAKADESDDEFDEDAPPKVTFIPLPQLRDTGGIEYADDRLHPNTLAFLKDLKANNKRSWLKSHDPEYRRALKDWESFVMTLTDKIIAADPTIPELPFKDVNFRIYRDIRFSNDPTPYKPHFSAAFSRTGRKGPYACYYIHVEPSATFVGGGLWHPDAAALHRLRASIDERPTRWRRVLSDRRFRETFLGLGSAGGSQEKKRTKGNKRRRSAANGEDGEGNADDGDVVEKALKAFAEKNKEGALKTRPKGFNPEHRDMQLLKLRNFTVGTNIADTVLTDAKGQEEVARIVGDMVGFITHLNRIVMPDPGDDDDSDDDEDGGED